MGPRLFSPFISNAMPLAAILLVAVCALPVGAASKNPFDQLKGYWSGAGTVTPINGKAEKVSCKVTYSVTGADVSQNIRCAGTDYKFNTASKLTYNAGKISGSWKENTYDAAGAVTGTASGETVHARISGDKFSGRMSISIKGGKAHSINIVQLDRKSGAYRPVANVSVRR